MLSNALKKLLVRAALWHHGTYCLTLWFGGCELDKDVLLCPSQEHKAFIERNFLVSLRQAVPSLTVIVPVAVKTRKELQKEPETRPDLFS